MRYSKADHIKTPHLRSEKEAFQKAPEMRLCEMKDCQEHGEFPAPRNRDALRDYRWFCLDHVREYNRNWNYFSGIEGEALEKEIRAAATWERPSWKFGTGADKVPRPDELHDIFDLFEDDVTSTKQAAAAQLDPEERAAWACLGIDPTEDKNILKKRYNQLVKQHHPDKHQGNQEAEQKAEEKLKEINLAYSLLRNKLAKT